MGRAARRGAFAAAARGLRMGAAHGWREGARGRGGTAVCKTEKLAATVQELAVTHIKRGFTNTHTRGVINGDAQVPGERNCIPDTGLARAAASGAH